MDTNGIEQEAKTLQRFNESTDILKRVLNGDTSITETRVMAAGAILHATLLEMQRDRLNDELARLDMQLDQVTAIMRGDECEDS